MIRDLMRSFSVINGLYASMQEACKQQNIAEDVGIPENLKDLFGYLSGEICEEVKNVFLMAEKIKEKEQLALSFSEKDKEEFKKGVEMIKALWSDYGWIIRNFEKEIIVVNTTKKRSLS